MTTHFEISAIFSSNGKSSCNLCQKANEMQQPRADNKQLLSAVVCGVISQYPALVGHTSTNITFTLDFSSNETAADSHFVS